MSFMACCRVGAQDYSVWLRSVRRCDSQKHEVPVVVRCGSVCKARRPNTPLVDRRNRSGHET